MPSVRKGTVTTFRIGLIADDDKSSKSKAEADLWSSVLLYGNLNYDDSTKSISVHWDQAMDEGGIKLSSHYGYGGRGMELSDLVRYNGRLYSVDDRTGIVYEIIDDSRVAPWAILATGDGRQSKGFKGEWMTAKGGLLYVGGHGTIWYTPTGEVSRTDHRWVKTITRDGAVTHINWNAHYQAMQDAAGYPGPGYITHESGAWSDVHNSWFFLPRKANKEIFVEEVDEKKAANILFQCSEDFSNINMTKIGTIEHPTRGYSTFKFMPGTNDQIIVALKSEEISGRYQSFITAFTIKGEILLDDLLVSEKYKFEGLEFV